MATSTKINSRSAKEKAPINPESDSEYEEEEMTVLVELNGMIDSDVLNQAAFERFKVIGIETDQPILQLNNNVFRGEYCETVGTTLIFKEDYTKCNTSDSIFGQTSSDQLKFIESTYKSLKMKRIFVSEMSDSSNIASNLGTGSQ